jgi:hypothetical protein
MAVAMLVTQSNDNFQILIKHIEICVFLNYRIGKKMTRAKVQSTPSAPFFVELS